MTQEQAGGLFRTRMFGLVAPSLGWAPPLRYLLRRARILKLMSRLPPGQLIEVGCGAGALLDDFSALGFESIGLETSPAALEMARSLAAHSGGSQLIRETPEISWKKTRRVVCAFDVLEHIEIDGDAVNEWVSWLQPRGFLLLSVPAHRHRWNEGDEWAGHWRRYDRRDIVHLLESRGLSIQHLECYGFPLANFTEMLGRRVYRRLLAEREQSTSKAQASASSGIERSEAMKLFRQVNTLPGRLILQGCLVLQAVAARTDWGSGYLVLAKLR